MAAQGFSKLCLERFRRLFNLRTGREIKKVLQGYSIGYYINGKFVTLNNLKSKLELIKQYNCPF